MDFTQSNSGGGGSDKWSTYDREKDKLIFFFLGYLPGLLRCAGMRVRPPF